MILERPSGPSILSHPQFVTVAAAAGCPSDGLPSTCARCASSAPARSPAADPPGSRPGTLREHAMNRRAALTADMHREGPAGTALERRAGMGDLRMGMFLQMEGTIRGHLAEASRRASKG